MITIAADELDYTDEYDPMHKVYYKGLPFTGTAQSGRETTEYVDGKAHGRYVLWFDNGILSAEGQYAEGECVSLQMWYEDGTLQHTEQNIPFITRYWDRDGILAFEGQESDAGVYQSRWFYKNGVVKQHYIASQRTDYFAKDGRLAMHVTYGHPRNTVTYVPAVLKTNYLDILNNYHYKPKLGQETANVEWYFWGWVWQLLKTDWAAALSILNHLKAKVSKRLRRFC